MKSEFVNHPTKGICILISEIRPSDFGENLTNFDHVFSNPLRIAEEIRRGRKIAAIKEVRTQTGWGLREAKHYIDKYEMNHNDASSYVRASQQFLDDHKLPDFIDKGDWEL